MQFQVRLFDPATSAVHEDTLEASSSADLGAEVSRLGQVLLSAKPLSTARWRPSPSPASSGKLDVAWWCRELRTLLSAGMTIVEAIETLNAQSMGAVLGRARTELHAALVDKLRQGQSLSVAMQSTGMFPPVLVAGVRASERTSSLIEALDDFLRYHEMLDRLRKQVVSAAIYPAVVVGLGAAITLFLLLFVMPRFSRMYADLHGPMSTATSLLVALSGLLNQHGSEVLGMVLLLGLGTVWAWRRGHIVRLAASAARSIGPLQRQLDEFRLAKLFHSLALMFRGGYALDGALEQCADLGLGDRLRAGVQAARLALKRGQRVSVAFEEAGLTDVVTRRLLAVGERTGNFDRVLQTIAERHASNFSTFVERATRTVEPLLLLMVALVVGGVVVMMYMPVFDIASSIH